MKVAVIFDNQHRPETTGFYVRRSLARLVDVEHLLPHELSLIPPGLFDLFVLVDDGLDYEIPDSLRPKASWAIDTLMDLDRAIQRFGDSDFLFAAQKNGASRLTEHTGRPAMWLPLACDPEIHRPVNTSVDYDVAFVGHRVGDRRNSLLDELTQRYDRTHICQAVFDDMTRAYSKARIGFNCGVADDLNMRLFEVPAHGIPLVTNHVDDNGLEELFTIGQHLMTYRDADELFDVVDRLLHEDRLRRNIAEDGLRHVLEHHTYDRRMKTMLKYVEGAQRSTLGFSKAVDYFEFPRPDVQALVPPDARRILDIGCGAGALGAALKSQRDVSVTGVELNPDAATRAETRLDAVVNSSVDELPADHFPDRSVDCIILADVLEHLRDPPAVLKKCRRWLAESGSLVISIPNSRHHSVISGLIDGNWTYEKAGLLDEDHVRCFTRREIEKLLFRCGFGIEQLQPIPGSGYQQWADAGRKGEVQIGPLHIGNLPPKEAEEFFTYQYVIRARPESVRNYGLTSIVIVTWNQLAFTKECVDSILARTDEAFELIFVDNGSTDGTPDYLDTVPDAVVIRNAENRGYAPAVNQGLQACRGENICLLNNDCVITTGWLDGLLEALHDDDSNGLVGPVSNNVSGEQQVSVRYTDLTSMDGFAWDQRRHRELRVTDRLVGFCLLFRREVMERIGLLDEQFEIGCFEDDDFCRRATDTGYRAIIAQHVFVHHYGSATFRGAGFDLGSILQQNEQRYRAKWEQQDTTSEKPLPSVTFDQSYETHLLDNGEQLLQRTNVRLSLCMIVRDNEETIEACLDSIYPWVDEIIVVDTGSTDATPDICRRFGARMYEFPWCDDFSAARNVSLEPARGEWVFWMDSDDTIDQEQGHRLRELVYGPHDDQTLGYVMQVHCPSSEAGQMTIVDHVKVFRNLPELQFEHQIHEQILPAIRRAGGRYTYQYRDYANLEVTEPNGGTTTVQFDGRRNITAVINPLGEETSWTYENGYATKQVNAVGNVTTLTYEQLADNSLRTRTIQKPSGGTTTFLYDSGYLETVIDAQGRRTTTVRDTNDLKIAEINALGDRTTTVYADGLPVAMVNPLGQRSTNVFDAQNQVVASVNALGNRTSFTYTNGQRTSVENPLENRTTSIFDSANRRLAEVAANQTRTSFVYDVGCRVIAQISPEGHRTSQVFDCGLNVATINPLGHRTSFVYDPNDRRLASISPMLRRTTTVYNSAGQAVASISPANLRTTNVFDAAGRTIASIAPDGTRISTIYDDCCSRPQAIIQPNGARTSYTYNLTGQQIRVTAPTGGITTTIYDDMDRQVATVNPLGHRSTTVYDDAGRAIAQIDALNNRTTSVYDAAGQTVASVNALGNRSSQVYDAAGQGIASVNPLGNRWSTAYDVTGRNVASVDPRLRRSTTVYDADSRVVASVDPEQNRSTTLYDAAGQTTGSIDARGFRTTATYNADGQPVEQIDARGYRTTQAYDTGGRGVAVINARGFRSTTIYNAVGQQAASENALGNRATTVFNAAGQATAFVDPLGNRTSSVFDTVGRTVASINPLGNRSTTIFNIASQVVALENANGNRTTNIYDAVGRTESQISALGYRTTTVYDDVGQRTALVDARGNRHSFAYSAAGQETQRIDPLNRRTTFAYDEAGQQSLRIDARGNRTTYAYSDNGQLTARKYPDGTRATFAYDETGNRTLMANATGRYSFAYDGNGQTTVAANPNDKAITYVYDPVGNRDHMDAPDSGRFTYAYDGTDQITLLHNAFNERTSFAYDDAGRRRVKKLANGTRASYTYDDASNLTNLHNLKSDSSAISTFDYRYNDINNRIAVGETNGDRVTWTYDDSSQLTSEHRSGANAYRNTFAYDPVGNRLVLNEDGTRTTTVFDSANQIEHSQAAAGRTTYTFDADGNQQIVQQPNGDRTTNVWDYENRLTAVQLPTGTNVTMTYNSDNRRVSREDA